MKGIRGIGRDWKEATKEIRGIGRDWKEVVKGDKEDRARLEGGN